MDRRQRRHHILIAWLLGNVVHTRPRDPALFVDDEDRPLRKPFLLPEDPVLRRDIAMRMKVAQQVERHGAKGVGPGRLGGLSVDADTAEDLVVATLADAARDLSRFDP